MSDKASESAENGRVMWKAYAIFRHDTLLRICLAHGMAEEIAYLTKQPKDFENIEEWYAYRDSTIRDEKQSPTNPYRIDEVNIFTSSELRDELKAVAEAAIKFSRTYKPTAETPELWREVAAFQTWYDQHMKENNKL